MSTSYDKADLITLSATFKNAAGTLTDPTAVTLRIMDPRGQIVTYSGGAIIHDSTGLYHMDFSTHSLHGTWWYRFEGTGAIQAGGEKSFVILSSEVK